MKEIECPICHKTVLARHHLAVYCSKECFMISRRKSVQCQKCGAEIPFTRSEIKLCEKCKKRQFLNQANRLMPKLSELSADDLRNYGKLSARKQLEREGGKRKGHS